MNIWISRRSDGFQKWWAKKPNKIKFSTTGNTGKTYNAFSGDELSVDFVRPGECAEFEIRRVKKTKKRG
jgi:hypothetical protein